MCEYVFYHISQSIVGAFNVLLEFAKICLGIGIKTSLGTNTFQEHLEERESRKVKFLNFVWERIISKFEV